MCVIFLLPKHVAAQPLDCDESPKQKSPPWLGGGLLHIRALFSSPVAQLQTNVPHAPQLPFTRYKRNIKPLKEYANCSFDIITHVLKNHKRISLLTLSRSCR